MVNEIVNLGFLEVPEKMHEGRELHPRTLLLAGGQTAHRRMDANSELGGENQAGDS